MTSTVTTPTPSRPLPAGPQRRRYRPTVLAIAGGSKPPRRRAPAAATSCAALAAPEKQSTAPSKLPAPSPAPEGTDYDEVAATLETLYKLSPVIVEEDGKRSKKQAATKKKRKQGRAKSGAATTTAATPRRTVVVRSQRRRRMDLGKRVEMRDLAAGKEDEHRDGERAFEEALLREHAVSTDMGSLDWRWMKIPPVLSAPQSARLFKIMQPMKAILEVQENLRNELQSEPTDVEVAEAMNMPVQRLRRLRDVGRAARNKLIKHNLRLVLYAINKYYPDMTGDERFADLCQAGANGLITAIDRFEPKRGFRISTYALFWIRHSVVRAMTLSSFTRFPFAMESVMPAELAQPVQSVFSALHILLVFVRDRNAGMLYYKFYRAGEAGDQQGEGGAVVRAREGADGRGDDEESGAVAGEVPRRGADDEAHLLAALAEPCHAGGAHQGGHRRGRHRGRHPQAQPPPPPRH
ncbi:hypothetical protein VPH35_011780 [Triticum aestivum]